MHFSLLKKGASQYFCPYNLCTSHWCLVIIIFLPEVAKASAKCINVNGYAQKVAWVMGANGRHTEKKIIPL